MGTLSITDTTNNTVVPNSKKKAKPRSMKARERSNIKRGMSRDSVSKTKVLTANRNPNRGLQNHSFDYDTLAEPDPNYTNGSGQSAVFSIFNQYALFTHPLASSLNDFKDIKSADGGIFRHTENRPELTIQYLLDNFAPDKNDRMPYYANDFLWCKYHGKIPLNRLITLRRYPFPTYDNLEFAGDDNIDIRPIAQAVTYFGDPTGNLLSNMIKINGKIGWKQVSAQIWTEESSPSLGESDSTRIIGNVGSISTKSKNNTINQSVTVINNVTNFYNRNSSTISRAISMLNGKGDLAGRQAKSISAMKNATDPSYTHRAFGPINVIKDTMTRDTGIGGDLTLDLVFDYQLKSYHNINPKLAMLDLINNMLALTYYHAKWWGGANRFFPKPMEQFGFLGDQRAFLRGDYRSYFSSVGNEIKNAFRNVGDMLSKMMDAIMSGNLSALGNIAMNAVGKRLDFMSAKSRPSAIAVHSLVSGVPVGEYHCVIGDPTNPIATIGNLIMQNFSIEFTNTLGFDGFPTGIKLRVSLKKARPLDSGDWQSIFALGQGRTYTPEAGFIDAINNVSNSTDFTGSGRIKKKSELEKVVGTAL